MATTPPLSPHRFDLVEAHIRSLVDSGALPHAQWLAARDGKILHSLTMGMARDDGTPLREDAVFRIASMTKPVTAVLCLMLLENGAVTLDQPVAEILPELADLRVHDGGQFPPFRTRAAARQPLIRDLLLHTAGFTYGFQTHSPLDQAYWVAGVDNFKAVKTREGILASIGALPLVDDPGSAFIYSVATDLLGIVIERLTDRPLDQLFQDRIFAPLGMVDTGFVLREDQQERYTDAWAIRPRGGRYLYDTAQAGLWSRPLSFPSGGGGLLSTTADYFRFCSMLMGQGELAGERLLKPDTVAMMTRNHLPGGRSIGAMARGLFAGESHRATGQGFGVAVTLPNGPGCRPVGEFHWPGLFSTFFSVAPSEGLILIFMTQLLSTSPSDLSNDIYRLLLA